MKIRAEFGIRWGVLKQFLNRALLIFYCCRFRGFLCKVSKISSEKKFVYCYVITCSILFI
jgi:hypothetical protein